VARQPFERLSDRIAPSLDLIFDPLLGLSGVLADVLEHARIELLGVHLRDVDEAQFKRLLVPVGRRALEAADVVAARLDPKLLALGVDVELEGDSGGHPT
jgi:hypothetical protein